MIKPFYIIPRSGRVAYLNVPKAACSSILRALYRLRLNEDNDPPARDIHGFETPYAHTEYFFRRWPVNYPPLPRSFVTFSFVRNPYARFYSFYKSKVVAGQAPIRHYRRFGIKEGCSFTECVRIITSLEPAALEHHSAPQAMILYDGDNMLADFIGKVENLQEDWQVMQKITGFDTVIGKANVTKSSSEPVYSADLRERVYKYYEDDFRIFGYDKDSVEINDNRDVIDAPVHTQHLLDDATRAALKERIAASGEKVRRLAEEFHAEPGKRENHFAHQEEFIHELLLKNILHLESTVTRQEKLINQLMQAQRNLSAEKPDSLTGKIFRLVKTLCRGAGNGLINRESER